MAGDVGAVAVDVVVEIAARLAAGDVEGEGDTAGDRATGSGQIGHRARWRYDCRGRDQRGGRHPAGIGIDRAIGGAGRKSAIDPAHAVHTEPWVQPESDEAGVPRPGQEDWAWAYPQLEKESPFGSVALQLNPLDVTFEVVMVWANTVPLAAKRTASKARVSRRSISGLHRI